MKIMWLFIATIFILSSLFLLTFGLGVIDISLGTILFFIALFSLGYLYRKTKKGENKKNL